MAQNVEVGGEKFVCVAMDATFESRLLEGGVGEEVIQVLMNQKITSPSVLCDEGRHCQTVTV